MIGRRRQRWCPRRDNDDKQTPGEARCLNQILTPVAGNLRLSIRFAALPIATVLVALGALGVLLVLPQYVFKWMIA
jgi:hypothetical protein